MSLKQNLPWLWTTLKIVNLPACIYDTAFITLLHRIGCNRCNFAKNKIVHFKIGSKAYFT
jgi:hypothetical protein